MIKIDVHMGTTSIYTYRGEFGWESATKNTMRNLDVEATLKDASHKGWKDRRVHYKWLVVQNKMVATVNLKTPFKNLEPLNGWLLLINIRP